MITKKETKHKSIISNDVKYETRTLDMHPDRNVYTKDKKYIKNKMLVMGNQGENFDMNCYMSPIKMQSSTAGKNGFLYKTHTVRNKLSNPNLIQSILKNKNKIKKEDKLTFSIDRDFLSNN